MWWITDGRPGAEPPWNRNDRSARPVGCRAGLFGGPLAGGRQQAREKSGDVPRVIRTAVVRAFHRQPEALICHVHANLLIDAMRDEEKRLHVQMTDAERIADVELFAHALELPTIVITPTRPQSIL